MTTPEEAVRVAREAVLAVALNLGHITDSDDIDHSLGSLLTAERARLVARVSEIPATLAFDDGDDRVDYATCDPSDWGALIPVDAVLALLREPA